ncbi:MAG: hypothetical protein DI598_04805 [Pseudopedobacter saltans]|uniref:Carrier domain-containing protein n=1 Tax=Pseudopedobacter saltans TaxID=151895 RepID=A0A2W5F9D0_9SPHI|nr:MAG: hypothetical protein DI598_04805 [Pseudopedobacter saltans]
MESNTSKNNKKGKVEDADAFNESKLKPIPTFSSKPNVFSRMASGALQDGVLNIRKRPNSYDRKLITELKVIVAQYTEYPELLEDIDSGTDNSFIEKLNIDSVDFVEIIVDVEEKYNIKIEDDEIKLLKTFDDLYSTIESKISSAS